METQQLQEDSVRVLQQPAKRRRTAIECGMKDGILVSHDAEGYTIQMPDRYDLTYGLAGTNKPGTIIERVAPLDKNQTVKDAIIRIPLDKLDSTKAIENINAHISIARYNNIDIQQEIVKQETVNAFHFNGEKFTKKAAPKGAEINGEIVSISKYFVCLQENPEEKSLTIVPTHKLLTFEDYKGKTDRLEAVKAKLHISNQDYNGIGRGEFAALKPGVRRDMDFDRNGRCTTYAPGAPRPVKAQEPIVMTPKQEVKKKTLSMTH